MLLFDFTGVNQCIKTSKIEDSLCEVILSQFTIEDAI